MVTLISNRSLIGGWRAARVRYGPRRAQKDSKLARKVALAEGRLEQPQRPPDPAHVQLSAAKAPEAERILEVSAGP
jgi:hypothetical protein